MGLFQNRRKTSTPDVESAEGETNPAAPTTTGDDLWPGAEAAFDHADVNFDHAYVDEDSADGHSAGPISEDRRSTDQPIPPPPPNVPPLPPFPSSDTAPAAFADGDPAIQPFGESPSALDMIASPIVIPTEPFAAEETPFGDVSANASVFDRPSGPGIDDPLAPNASIETDFGILSESEFIDLSDVPPDALLALEPHRDGSETSKPPDNGHQVGIPLDTAGLYDILELEGAPTNHEVAAAYRSFLDQHDPANEADHEQSALLRRIRREVNAAYAMFRLTQSAT